MEPVIIQPSSQSPTPEPQPLMPPVGPPPPPPPPPDQAQMPSTPPPPPSPMPHTASTPMTTAPSPQPAFMNDSLPASNGMPESGGGKRSFWRSKLVLAVAIFLLLLGGGAGAYFGYVAPNKPANIWSKALSNTGKGYDKLSQYATTHKAEKGLAVNGSFKVSGSIATDGTFEGSSSDDNGDFKATLSAGGLKTNFELRTLKSNSTSPDAYFKIDGIQGLGDLVGGEPQIKDALNGINGKWYFIDHSLFDQFAQTDSNNTQFTAQDLSSVLKAVGDASKQNIFTTDTTKMAFTIKKAVGKEKQDGRSVYHYEVGINKQNLKAYVDGLCKNLKNSNLKKFFSGSAEQTADSLGCKTASKSIDAWDSNHTADVWVDLHTKLIHKIRFTDTKNKDNYFDIGQDYQGGDEFPFSLGFHEKSSGQTTEGSLGLNLNTKTNVVKLTGSVNTSGDPATKASFNMTITPSNNTVKVDKPTDARNILELVNDLGFGDIYGNIQSSSKDTERQTDIYALSSLADEFNANNGYYPTLNDINNTSWRSKYAQDFDSGLFQDPEGTSNNLVASPAAHVYAYQALPAGCDNTKNKCTNYKLTATLDDGTPFEQQALDSPSNTNILN